MIETPGTRLVQRDDLYIEHRPDPRKTQRRAGRNLRIVEKAVQGGDHSSRSLYYYACELRDAGRNEQAVEAYGDYLESGRRWEEYAARVSMSECASRCGRAEEASICCTPRCGWTRPGQKPFSGSGKSTSTSSSGSRRSPTTRRRQGGSTGRGFRLGHRLQLAALELPRRLPCQFRAACRSDRATLRSLQLGNPDRDRYGRTCTGRSTS